VHSNMVSVVGVYDKLAEIQAIYDNLPALIGIMPVPVSGDEGKIVVVNEDGDGYELVPAPEGLVKATQEQARGRSNDDTYMTPRKVGDALDAYLPVVAIDGRAANTYVTPPLDAWAIGPNLSGGD